MNTLPNAPTVTLDEALEEAEVSVETKHRLQYLRDGARRFMRSYRMSGERVDLAQARDWWSSANKLAEKHGLETISFVRLQLEVSESMPGEVVS